MDAEAAAIDRERSTDDALSWLPAWKLRELIGKRELSPVEVVEHFLARIARLDPVYHAFRMVDADAARAQALVAEQAVLAGEALGPLHGVPVALKEHIPVGGLHWHNLGSNEKGIAPRDGIEAERLRAAGAILVGTTVAGLTPMEFGASDAQPLNAWNRNHICGDSSSGSACAAATAMVPVSIAVDGLGSTRLPAAYSGLVGLMATRGRVPALTSWGDLTSRLLSRVGPFARDVRDAATILSVLAQPDGRDPFGLPDAPPDYLADIDAGARGMRLAWTDDFGIGAAYATAESAEVIATVRRAAGALSEVGATIEPLGGGLADPTDACNLALAGDPGLFIHAKLPEEALRSVRETRATVIATLEKLLGGRDFILSPTTQHIAPTLQQWHDAWQPGADGQPSKHMSAYTSFNGFVNLIGWPAISLPAGMVSGVPVALQIIGRPNSEVRLLQLAQAFAASFQVGRPPLAVA